MGYALIIPAVSFANNTLGKVTRKGAIIPIKSLAISGEDTVNNSNNTSQYTVSFSPSNATQTDVKWSIESGSGYASINEKSGLLSVRVGATNATVTIKVMSILDNSVYDTKTITVSYYSEVPYQEKTCVVFNGSAYVDTGYKPNSNTNIEAEISSTIEKTAIWYFGEIEDDKKFGIIRPSNATIKAEFASYSKELSVDELDLAHVFNLNSSGLSVDNDSVCEFDSSEFTSNNSLYIGYAEGTSSLALNGKVYYMKITEGDNTIHDFIPCILVQDIDDSKSYDSNSHLSGECGFWDKIDNVFYPALSGTLTCL